MYKEFKGYFRTKKRRKAAQEFPSVVEDSDIFILFNFRLCFIAFEIDLLGTYAQTQDVVNVLPQLFISSLLKSFLCQKKKSKTDATVTSSLKLTTIDTEKITMVRM